MGGGRQGEPAAPGPGPGSALLEEAADAAPFAPFEAEEFYDENNAKAEQHKELGELRTDNTPGGGKVRPGIL